MAMQRKVKGMAYVRFLQYSIFGMQMLAYLTTLFNGESVMFRAVEIFVVWFVCFLATSYINRKFGNLILVLQVANYALLASLMFMVMFASIPWWVQAALVFWFCCRLDQIDNLRNMKAKLKKD